MKKKILRSIFWLALLSAASRDHTIMLGLFLYPIAWAFVLLLALSPVILTFAAWLLWYWLRHRRLPDWLVGAIPRRRRRRTRQRWSRPPRRDEAPTEEMPVVTGPFDGPPVPAGLAGEAARSHLN
jgi:hypothetical protein